MSRYTTRFVSDLFSPESTLFRWKQVEVAVLDAQAQAGLVPARDVSEAQYARTPTVSEWRRHEAECKHEMVAFLRAWSPPVPVHIGVTSSDIIDTAWSLLWRDYKFKLRLEGDILMDALANLALARHDNHRLSRTHGQAAIASPEELQWLHWRQQIYDAYQGLLTATAHLQVAKIAGPAGDHGHISVSRPIQDQVAATLGLHSDMFPSQIVARGRLAAWAAAAANFCTAIEALAMQVRLGSQTGIDEIREGFDPLQTGSSSMVHKQNPILSERLCGIGRMSRSMVAPIMEGMVQWHQRDLTHSSVERTLVPELAGFVFYSMTQGTSLVRGLEFDDDAIQANIEAARPGIESWERLADAQLNQRLTYDQARLAAQEA